MSHDIVHVTNHDLSLLLIFISTGLVFFMQAGFALLELGLVQSKNLKSIATRNLLDWFVVAFCFIVFGFGLLSGASYSTGGWMGIGAGLSTDPEVLTNVLFQSTFAATAFTIVSGTIAERTSLRSYLLGGAVVGGFLYPIFAHWVWGGMFTTESSPWLKVLGFVDFAGATAVHSLGGWFALVGAVLIGPRVGRYKESGELNEDKFRPSNYALSVVGTLILWFGWFGFNGGTWGAVDGKLALVVANTNIAAIAAGLSGTLHCLFLQKGDGFYFKTIGSALGGLVAITASCHIMTPFQALCIGLGAGIVHNYCYDVLVKSLRIDDVVGAIPVHCGCGVYGTLMVAIADPKHLPLGERLPQFFIQVVGVSACMVWAVFTGLIVFHTLKRVVGLRVSPEMEYKGLDLVEEFNSGGALFDSDGFEGIPDDDIERLLAEGNNDIPDELRV